MQDGQRVEVRLRDGAGHFEGERDGAGEGSGRADLVGDRVGDGKPARHLAHCGRINRHDRRASGGGDFREGKVCAGGLDHHVLTRASEARRLALAVAARIED